MNTVRILTQSFQAVGPAHHRAFLATDGNDPEWPLWYAKFLIEDLREALDPKMTVSALVRCLIAADEEHQARDPHSPWPVFYANHFAERFGESASKKTDSFALYYYPGCPFCRRVLVVIEELKLDVEMRNIQTTPDHYEALVRARGRATVPVLRIRSAGGDDRWMPESSDIMNYLRRTHG